MAPRLGAEWQALGDEALRRASASLSGSPVPCGIMHGDFAPWNTQCGSDRLFVYDWESAEWDAPLGWDIFHFQAQVASLLNRRMRNAWPAVDDVQARASFWLYLLHSACAGLEEESPVSRGLEFRRELLLSELRRDS